MLMPRSELGLFRRYWSWSCWPNDGCAVREHVWTLMLVMLQLLRLVPLLSCLSRLMRVLLLLIAAVVGDDVGIPC